jgi:LysM repeat protein
MEAPVEVIEERFVEMENEALEPVPARRVERRKSHVVVSGDTLSEIAEQDGCDAFSLAAANGLDPEGKLLVGTILMLPRPGEVIDSPPVLVEVEPQPATKPRPPVLTPVPASWTKPAAAAERVAVQSPGAQVRSPRYPYVAWPEEEAPPGPVVELGVPEEDGPVPGPVQPVSGLTMSAAAPKTTIQYLVQPGDEWERIAAAHFTSASLLKLLNRTETLAAGQVIEVPVDQCLTPGR